MILGFFMGIIIMSAIGCLLGFGLAWLARVMAVETDPKTEQILAILPGANCGACGYPGCAGYADAIVKDGVETNLCSAANQDMITKIGNIVGRTADAKKRYVAKIKCMGVIDPNKLQYAFNGEDDCFAVYSMYQGNKECKYGCVGYGNCAKICPTGAIKRDELNRLYVDSNICIGCKKCMTVCPARVIEMVPIDGGYYIACNSHDNAKVVREICGKGCLGCKACERLSGDANRICVDNFLSKINYESETDLSLAATKCPGHVIIPIITPIKKEL